MISMRVRVCIFDTCVNEEEATGLREKSIGFDLEGARKYNWIEYISREDSGKIKIIPCFFSKFPRKIENE